MTPPQIFDRNARRLRRDRTAGAPESFFAGLIIDEIIARLDAVTRVFETALLIGAEPRLGEALAACGTMITFADPSARRAAALGGVQVDEDNLPFASASFDLIVVAGLLDTVADLPGALLLIRRALRPDGLFLGCIAAAPSLATLRVVLAQADANDAKSVARMHPQIDVQAAGNLLVRAGFALPVADLDSFVLSYSDLETLFTDLRGAAATNVLAERHPATKGWFARAKAAFAGHADSAGRVHENLSLVSLIGWAPSSDQPQPAARGSASVSLAEALRQRA